MVIGSKIHAQVNYCAVFAVFEDIPVVSALSKISLSCKIKIEYEVREFGDYRITQSFEGIPVTWHQMVSSPYKLAKKSGTSRFTGE